MSSKKKRAVGSHDDVDNPSAASSSAAAVKKRCRVSIACEACRAAREKCDGVRPTCGTCVTNKRPCSYAPASKKRGVKTGYLRTIELSLAWVFDQIPESEEALHRLLTHNDGREGARLLRKENSAGTRLHKKWSKSQVHKEISRLLSDGAPPPADTSTDDSDSEGDVDMADIPSISQLSRRDSIIQPIQPNIPTTSTPVAPINLRLPKHWQRLLDIYFSYTHCWFPLLDRNALLATASSYRPEGVSPAWESGRQRSSSHAELWAALAVASFQDRASSVAHADESLPPEAIFSAARGLIPPLEDGSFELAHIRAMLLHSLVLLGRGRSWAAWMLVGVASRASLQKRSHTSIRSAHWRSNSISGVSTAEGQLIMASYILDTFLSLCNGQMPHLRGEFADDLSLSDFADPLDSSEVWNAVPGLVNRPGDAGAPPAVPLAQPLLTFLQLFKFSKIVNASIDTDVRACECSAKITPDKLARTLDPQFSFCDSLMWSTPALPSAFLLRATYLTANVALTPSCRASLLSAVMEMVESCLAYFGPGGCPPLLVTLIEFVQQRGKMEKMHEVESNKWDSTIQTLRDVWKDETANLGLTSAYPPQEPFTPFPGYLSWQTPGTVSTTGSYSLPQGEQHMDQVIVPEDDRQTFAPSTASPVGTALPIQATNTSYPVARAYPINTRYSAAEGLQALDYDAILDELGSTIDCTDGVDMDPQFMTNLGFAPGYDLGDKCFRESLGLNDDLDTIGV